MIKKKIKENYEYSLMINKEYQELITDVISYLRVELNEADGEEAVSDVLGILLSAQERGEDLLEIVGDYKVFCDEIISAYKDGDKYYKLKGILDYFSTFALMMPFFITIDMVGSILGAKLSSISEALNSGYNLSVSPILNLIISLIVGVFTVEFVVKRKQQEGKKTFLIIFLVFFCTMVLMLVSNMFGRKIVIYTFSSVPTIIIGIAILVLVLYITNMVITVISLRKAEKKRMKINS